MNSLALQLWQARRSGSVVHFDSAGSLECIEQAYAIQHEIAALCGQPLRGFKVGSTSLAAQQMLGTDEPGSGLLLAPYVHESPARIAIEAAHTPAVEGEFVFKLGRDLPPREAPYAIEEIAGAVTAVAGGIEVVGTRFSGGLAGKGRLLITADCGANIALVSGPWRQDLSAFNLKAHRVTMTINGALRGAGTGDHALGDPLNVVLWLANQQAAAGRGLKSGEIVSTGTCTGLDPVRRGDRVQADFGELGTVEISFE
jgi:2-keto-4-pentenoate hydratase